MATEEKLAEVKRVAAVSENPAATERKLLKMLERIDADCGYNTVRCGFYDEPCTKHNAQALQRLTLAVGTLESADQRAKLLDAAERSSDPSQRAAARVVRVALAKFEELRREAAEKFVSRVMVARNW